MSLVVFFFFLFFYFFFFRRLLTTFSIPSTINSCCRRQDNVKVLYCFSHFFFFCPRQFLTLSLPLEYSNIVYYSNLQLFRRKKFNDVEKKEIWEYVQNSFQSENSVNFACVKLAEKCQCSLDKVRSCSRRMERNGGRIHGHKLFSEEEEPLLGLIQAYDFGNIPLTKFPFKVHVLKMAGKRKMSNFAKW